MSSDIFVIYQIDNSDKNREYRCRSYEYQIQHGFMITADNYGTGYSGTATRGMGEEAIRKKMESINPDKFKIRKFGVSDVIGLTAAGKTSFFYVDKDRLVRFNGFFPKPQSGTYLILDEGGYQVAGQKGTWLVSDEVEVDGQRFVQMRSEQTKNPPPSIILHESGAFVTQTALGFDGEATRKMRSFLQGPKPELLHHQKFFENGTAERAKESGTEQNYNMIDQENSGCGRIRLDQSSQYARSNHSAKAVRYGAGSFEAGHLRIERPADCKSIFGHRSLRRLWTEHGAAYRMDESKFEGVTKINDHEFELHNAHCFKIDVPQIGSAQAIYYDVAALKTCCEHIRKNHIPHPIVYIMACRIGPFAAHFYKEIHKLGGIVFRNPDGECEII